MNKCLPFYLAAPLCVPAARQPGSYSGPPRAFSGTTEGAASANWSVYSDPSGGTGLLEHRSLRPTFPRPRRILRRRNSSGGI